MKTNIVLRLLSCLFVLGCFSSCLSNPVDEIEKRQENLDPAFEELLASIDSFEQENNYATDAPTRKIHWGFVVAADCVPLVLLAATDIWGVGLGLGVINSFFAAIFEMGYSEVNWQRPDGFLTDSSMAMVNEDDAGTIHNLVISNLIQEMDVEEFHEMSDWDLFNLIKNEMTEYLPDESIDMTRNEFQQLMQSIPDPREYVGYDSYESAVFAAHPELADELTVTFRVLRTVLAQETEELAESYTQGVMQLIRESSIPNASKQGLISSISVQKASKELWYE